MDGPREERAKGDQRDARAALERFQLHGIRETGEELGRGSYAAVIEVDYKGMRCAAKKIHDILRDEGGRLVERFEEECRLLGTLRHPHIVQFLGIYFDPATDLPVLVMEFLPTTLAQCVGRYGHLPAEICYAILRDVALGLRYLHEQRPRVIHRDLSANNVLLTGDMGAKISDLGVAKILQINPAEMSRMTPIPGTYSYMPPEVLHHNPRYDIEVDVFSFGVMMVHVLSGQWPYPSEATRVDPCNPASVIGVSEVERRAQYLDVIGRPSDEEEGHPLMALIERCLNNSPNLRPNASELVEKMNDASAQQTRTFSNRVKMMQRIDSVQREKETLQTRVSELEGQVERSQVAQREQIEQSQRQEAALAVEIEQLQLQVGSLEAEKTHISTTAAAKEMLLHTELQKKEESFQASLESKDRQHQIELQRNEDMVAAKERQLQTQQKEHQERLGAKEIQFQAEVREKAIKLSSQNSLLSKQKSTIEALHTKLQQARLRLASGTQVHAFSPNASLVWRECASIPVEMAEAKTTSINRMLYMGGGTANNDSHKYLVYKYDLVKDEWTTLPPAPVKWFGVGQLNGKLVIVGGVKEGEEEEEEEEEEEGTVVHVFEEDTQQWVKSIPPVPRRLLASTVVSHGSSLVVCGAHDDTSSASVLVYNSQTSQWHLVAALPLPFMSAFSSAVVVNDTYYIAVGIECVAQEKCPPSPAVFSLPLSTLLDPNAPQDPSIWQRMQNTPCHMSHLAATGGCLLALGGIKPVDRQSWKSWLFLSSKTRKPALSNEVYAFCPATSSWIKIGYLPDIQFDPAITTLSNGELFIAGIRDRRFIHNDEHGLPYDYTVFKGKIN